MPVPQRGSSATRSDRAAFGATATIPPVNPAPTNNAITVCNHSAWDNGHPSPAILAPTTAKAATSPANKAFAYAAQPASAFRIIDVPPNSTTTAAMIATHSPTDNDPSTKPVTATVNPATNDPTNAFVHKPMSNTTTPQIRRTEHQNPNPRCTVDGMAGNPMDAPHPMDPPNPTAPAHIGTSPQCKAHNRAGNRCERAVTPGAAVCRFHGGAAPQVRRQAAIRLAELVEPALATLDIELTSTDNRPADRLRAAENILDRAGLGRATTPDAELARALLIERILAMQTVLVDQVIIEPDE